MGKLHCSPATFWPVFHTSCVSKLMECIILFSPLFFLRSSFILSLHKAGFRTGQFTLNQILYLSRFIFGGFIKPKWEFQTTLGAIDFSKAFNSVWHPTFIHKLILAGPPSLYLKDSIFSDSLAGFLKPQKSLPLNFFRCSARSVFGPVFSLHL